MNKKCFLIVILFIINELACEKLATRADNDERSLMSELYAGSNVVNDNICNNKQKSVAYDVIMIDNPMSSGGRGKREILNNEDFEDRPRPDQKSLLIVFDATGSMHDDLEQLRSGAQEIINEMSARSDNPIFNYILVVFRDPDVEAPFDTRNSDDLLSKLESIKIHGGGDCPEMAIQGLKIALQLALPNSLAYVFSDATAKDFKYHEDALGLIQQKQVTVNFLLTGDCNNPNSNEYQVYHHLSRASNGQVYDMSKSNVKDVLLAIRHTVNHNYAALKSVDSETAGLTQTKLNVDKSISELSVSVSGKNPTLTIKNPRNETVKSADELALSNLKLVKIKDPLGGSWNVEAHADSSHSIRLGAISEIKFRFGFSVSNPKKITETSFQPLRGVKNILSIFVEDPELIANITDVTITLLSTENKDQPPTQFKIPIREVSNGIFSTQPFDVPRQMFNVQLNGFDANENVIERLITTGLQSKQGSSPEVKVEVNRKKINEHEKLLVKCIVKSLTLVNISIEFQDEIVSSFSSSQSNELQYEIENVRESNGGNYCCVAVNEFGRKTDEVEVEVISAPKIQISMTELTAVEGSEASLECQLEKPHQEFTIKWLNEFGEILFENSTLYKFRPTRDLNFQLIFCEFKIPGFPSINNSALIYVEYKPHFKLDEVEQTIKVVHSSSAELNCETDENPKASVDWIFTNPIESKNLNFRESIYTIDGMDESKKGIYECQIQNKIGRVKRSFNVDIMPKQEPQFKNTNDFLVANETDTVEFVCEVVNSMPLTRIMWSFNETDTTQTQTISSYDDKNDVAKIILKIDNVHVSENFECIAENELGLKMKSFELVVQNPAKIDTILILLNDEDNTKEIEENEIVKVLEDEKVSLDCSVDGLPIPNVKWFRDNVEISHEDDQTFLTFEEISTSHEGHYTCEAENLLGVDTKSFILQVQSPPKVKNNVSSKTTVIEGANVKFVCEFDGKPDPKISWFMGDKKIDDERNKFAVDGNSLSFKAETGDSAVYSCVGWNDYGKDLINFTLNVLGIPTFISSDDESIKVKMNENISTICDANGFPQPNISWYENNQLISNESILFVQNVYESKIYICNAQNDAGLAQKIFYINVVQAPAVLSKFHNIDILTNQTKTQECVADGIPTPNVHWTFNNLKISDENILTLNSSMDSGKYFCVAENSEGRVETPLDVKIINKPKLIENHEIKSNIRLREGDQIELICPYENFNFILWSFNGQHVHDDEKFENRLKIENIEESKSGLWRCEVVNSAGSEFHTFNISVLTSPIVHPSWNFNNRISEFLFTESDIDERYFKVGETLTLNCSAKGTPKPKIVWKKATDVIAEGELLVIANLEFHHSDIYSCSAQNENGIVKKFFRIDVISAPFIENDLEIEKQFHQRIGDSIILRCRITGNPQPSIFWFKDNVLLDETDNFYEISKIKVDDDGVYKCIGKNSWGRESIEFHLNVMEGAKVIDVVIEDKSKSRNDNSVRLSCLSKGNPMPIISWLSNGHILSTTSKLNFEKLLSTMHESSIFFTGHGQGITYLDPFKLKVTKERFYSQLTKVDEKTIKLDIIFRERSEKVAGNYKCYAYNALGRDEKSVGVEILTEPMVTEKEYLDQIEILESLPLIITCPMTGQPLPKVLWFKENRQLYENETIKFLNANRFLSISEAYSWHSGNYSCKGVNKLGEKSIDFHVRVLAPPKFVDNSLQQQQQSSNNKKFFNDKIISYHKFHDRSIIKVMKNQDIKLECFADGFPKPKVHWLKVDFYDRNKNEILDETDNILIIEKIQESSNFMCYLNNTMGNVKKIFEIDVQMPPKFIDEKTEEKVNVKLHHGHNFDCKVTGNPEPRISWIFNDNVVTTKDKEFYLTSDNQIMRIIESKKSNQGKYLCRAENDFGKLEKVFYVKIDVPIEWSNYGSWSECSQSCGIGGIQYRTRVCLLSNGLPAQGDDQNCIGENVETRKCNQLACPVNGGWSNWSKWSQCPTCIDESIHKLPITSERTRRCDSPMPSNGGLECFGENTEKVECLRMKFCPVNGGWSEWSSWSSCSKTCGSGHRMRKRFCSNPEPKFNGTLCDGENVEYEECRIAPCYGSSLKKTFDADNEDYAEDYFSDSNHKFKEIAELEIEDDEGVTRSFQLTRHREVEYVPPVQHDEGREVPKIRITLDTYKPISAETVRNFANEFNDDAIEDIENDLSFENVDFESSEEQNDAPMQKNCIRGFYFNAVNNQCEDINECHTNRSTCKAGEVCINLMGSFKCERERKRT